MSSETSNPLPTCRGSFLLNTACGSCSRCKEEIATIKKAEQQVKQEVETEKQKTAITGIGSVFRFAAGLIAQNFNTPMDITFIVSTKGDNKPIAISSPLQLADLIKLIEGMKDAKCHKT